MLFSSTAWEQKETGLPSTFSFIPGPGAEDWPDMDGQRRELIRWACGTADTRCLAHASAYAAEAHWPGFLARQPLQFWPSPMTFTQGIRGCDSRQTASPRKRAENVRPARKRW